MESRILEQSDPTMRDMEHGPHERQTSKQTEMMEPGQRAQERSDKREDR